MTDRDFMARAIALAIDNVRSGRGGPFGAVVVHDGAVIGEGANLVTSTNDPTAHAEIVAIREACRKLGDFQLHGCDIYSTCEPCPMCLGAIYWARPARVFYAGTRSDAREIGFDDEFIYEQLALPLANRALAMTPLMREEALDAFRIWREAPGKVAY